MTPLEGDLVSLVKRLVRCLPTDHSTRIEALDFLTKHGLISPLRQIEVVEPKVKLGKLPIDNELVEELKIDYQQMRSSCPKKTSKSGKKR